MYPLSVLLQQPLLPASANRGLKWVQYIGLYTCIPTQGHNMQSNPPKCKQTRRNRNKPRVNTASRLTIYSPGPHCKCHLAGPLSNRWIIHRWSRTRVATESESTWTFQTADGSKHHSVLQTPSISRGATVASQEAADCSIGFIWQSSFELTQHTQAWRMTKQVNWPPRPIP